MIRLAFAAELGSTLTTHCSGLGIPFGNTRTLPYFSRLPPTSCGASAAFASDGIPRNAVAALRFAMSCLLPIEAVRPARRTLRLANAWGDFASPHGEMQANVRESPRLKDRDSRLPAAFRRCSFRVHSRYR